MVATIGTEAVSDAAERVPGMKVGEEGEIKAIRPLGVTETFNLNTGGDLVTVAGQRVQSNFAD